MSDELLSFCGDFNTDNDIDAIFAAAFDVLHQSAPAPTDVLQIESRTDAVVLNRRHFTWNRNSLSRKFRDCKNADEFIALFHALQGKAVAIDGEATSEEFSSGGSSCATGRSCRPGNSV